jgi:hypothetical protein
MHRLGVLSVSIAALSLGLAMASPQARAQSTPTDIPAVMGVCTPVIRDEYAGDRDQWGDCIAAVDAFLHHIGAASEQADPIIADLIAALVELYEPQYCPEEDTELPIAIELAAQSTLDRLQQAQIIEISHTLKDCGRFATAALELPAPAASAF